MTHKALVFSAALTSRWNALAASYRNTSVVPNGWNDLTLSAKLPVPVGLPTWSEKQIDDCDPAVQDTPELKRS